MKKIPLTRGKSAIVDDNDFKRLIRWKWHISAWGYAIRARRKEEGEGSHLIFLHHKIIGFPPKGKDVDHINGNKLDNRKRNLRMISHLLNGHNRAKLNKNNSSGCKNVALHKPTGKWRARVKVDYQDLHLGLFLSKQTAQKAALEFKKKLFSQYE